MASYLPLWSTDELGYQSLVQPKMWADITHYGLDRPGVLSMKWNSVADGSDHAILGIALWSRLGDALQLLHSWLISGGHQISARFYRL